MILGGLASAAYRKLKKATKDSTVYVKPKYILNAVKAKCGPVVFVIGPTAEDLDAFEEKMRFRNLYTSPEVEEVGRALVDVNYKSHENTDTRRYAAQERMEGEAEVDPKPQDWYDEFKIESSKSGNTKKSFKISHGSSSTNSFGFGASGNLSSGYFNLGASIGANANFSRSKTKTEHEERAEEENLSQGFVLTDVLKVPPRTRVRAEIKTHAVTFRLRTTTEYSIEADAVLAVLYRARWQRMLGGTSSSTCVLWAAEMFCNETNFRIEDGIVKFQRDGAITYIGEEVEIKKKYV